MGSQYTRKVIAGLMVVAAGAATGVGALSAAAGAHTSRQVKTAPILSLAPGALEISLGEAPAWLPLSHTAQTLTLISGAPTVAHPGRDNAYVGFVAANATCAPNPSASRRPYYELPDFYAAADSAATHAGVFAPDGGAPATTYLASIHDVVITQSTGVRACIWLAPGDGAVVTPKPTHTSKHKHKRRRKKLRPVRSLAATQLVPLLNNTFAASVSNLSGATPGNGGYTMYAMDGGRPFSFRVSTSQCGRTSNDPSQAVPAGTPASETVSISTSPCTMDESTFTFTGGGESRAILYPITDALAAPAVSLGLSGCELDPLTGVTLTAAEQYLTSVGCTLGQVEVTPYVRTLPRGAVSWASVDGGVAELAPAQTVVDLVLNGKP
jgi:hypothetical protein